jgi:hypothetical protein
MSAEEVEGAEAENANAVDGASAGGSGPASNSHVSVLSSASALARIRLEEEEQRLRVIEARRAVAEADAAAMSIPSTRQYATTTNTQPAFVLPIEDGPGQFGRVMNSEGLTGLLRVGGQTVAGAMRVGAAIGGTLADALRAAPPLPLPPSPDPSFSGQVPPRHSPDLPEAWRRMNELEAELRLLYSNMGPGLTPQSVAGTGPNRLAEAMSRPASYHSAQDRPSFLPGNSIDATPVAAIPIAASAAPSASAAAAPSPKAAAASSVKATKKVLVCYNMVNFGVCERKGCSFSHDPQLILEMKKKKKVTFGTAAAASGSSSAAAASGSGVGSSSSPFPRQ